MVNVTITRKGLDFRFKATFKSVTDLIRLFVKIIISYNQPGARLPVLSLLIKYK
jgi:hypothetical protein